MKFEVIKPEIMCLKDRCDSQGYLVKVKFINNAENPNNTILMRATRLNDEFGTLVPFDIRSWSSEYNDYLDIKDCFKNWGELLELGKIIRGHNALKELLDSEVIIEFGADEIFRYLNEDLQERMSKKSS